MLNNSKQPSAAIMEIYSFTNIHKSYINNKYKGFVHHFEHAFELFVDLIFAINFFPKTNYPKHRTSQFFLLKNNLNPLFSGFERSISGFYDDGLILFRACYEAIIKIYFISFFSNDLEAVLVRNLPKGKKQFNLTQFIENDLNVDWKFIYRLLSGYTHGNTSKTLFEILDLNRNGQDKPISFDLVYNEDNFSITLNICNFIVWNYLKIFLELMIKPMEDSFEPKLLKNLIDSEKAYEAIIKSTPNKIALTYNDVKNIFSVISEKESSY